MSNVLITVNIGLLPFCIVLRNVWHIFLQIRKIQNIMKKIAEFT